MTEYTYVGKSIPRIDALEKVTGQAMFTADYKMPRMLYCKISRSPYPHARITRIDTSKAEKVPGVRAVITAKDTPAVRFSIIIQDQYTLPTDSIVRLVDQPVAAVAAETIEAAEEAVDLIEVDYEELPRCLTIDEAHSKDPPAVLHPDLHKYTISPQFAATFRWKLEKDKPNVMQTFRVNTGDVEEGFREADVIVENEFFVPRIHHALVEPHGVIAWVDNYGIINLIWGSQGAWFFRAILAGLFGVPEDKIRIHVPYVGGGLGGKFTTHEVPIVVAMALKTRRPVKFIQGRREAFLSTKCSFCMKTHIKDGYKKDGTLIAREIDMKSDVGAYCQEGALLIKNAAFGAIGTYRIPNYKLLSSGVYCNLPIAGGYRGVGTPEVTWAVEQQMDIAAEKLGISSLEIRLKNLLNRGEKDVTGTPLMSTAAKEVLEKVAEAIAVDEEIVQQPGPWKIGRGIAIGNKYTVAGLGSAVTVKVFGEGTIEVRHNVCEMGQGTHSALAQMASEEFGIPIEDVRVVFGDTATCPYDAGTFSSRSIFHTGNALVAACRDAKQKMFALAAPILGVPANELETKDGKIYRKSLPSLSMSVADLFTSNRVIAKEGSEIVGYGSYTSPIILEDENGHSERMVAYYAYCAYGAEVAVNIETGEARLLRIVGCGDMGQPINPKMCEGQMEGGMSQGLGRALYEVMRFDNGIPLNPSFMDYKIPTVMEMPAIANIESMMARDLLEEGPYGAKGFGESTLSAMAPAVANAVSDAIGMRFYQPPIEREMIWKALRKKAGKKADFPTERHKNLLSLRSGLKSARRDGDHMIGSK